jgi:uncharacterized membrane protein
MTRLNTSRPDHAPLALASGCSPLSRRAAVSAGGFGQRGGSGASLRGGPASR